MNGRNAPVGRSLMLVNAAHPVPASALSERLERVRGVSGDIPLEPVAARALRGLVSAVGGDGLVLAVSGFRGRGEQAAIWDEAVAENGVAFARSYVARPGCSEHETGLAVDVTLATEPYDFIRPSFPDEGIGREFRRSAARFGFIERYRAGEEPVTGIAAEPWAEFFSAKLMQDAATLAANITYLPRTCQYFTETLAPAILSALKDLVKVK